MKTMLKRVSMLVVLLAVAIVPGPLQGADPQPAYTECMDRAINHKYAMIDAGVSYQEAHEHYLWHTQQCYLYFWANN